MRALPAECMRIVRFFCVACAAALVDALVGLLVLHLVGLPLSLCVVAGFVSGFIVAYVLHHAWTFHHEAASQSHIRSLSRFAASNVVLLGGRMAFVWLGTQFLVFMGFEVDKWIESFLYIAMLGFSFVLNYALCRMWVFRPGR